MNLQINLRVLVLIVFSVGLLMVYYGNYVEKKGPRLDSMTGATDEIAKEIDSQVQYAISSPACKMLSPDPWDESVRKYLVEPQSLVCSPLPPLTYIDQSENSTNTLRIHQKNLKKYKINSKQSVKCCYSLVERINQNAGNYNSSADNQIQLSKCKEFADRVLLPNNAEFVLVKCQSYQEGKKNGKEFYKDMHLIVPVVASARSKLKKTKEIIEKSSQEKNKSNRERLNVIILGIDSVSKLNLRRIMPKTLKYLQENNWIELNGYNKIGENTFPNLMAILNGEPMKNLDFWWRNSSMKMDDCPAIWKDYSQAGYVTLYAEDTPAISTFNFMRTGFVEKPTDYYMRPFMLASHQLLPLKKLNGLPVCTGPVLVLDHIFDYAKRFYRTFGNTSHFSLLWSNSLSHNDLNAPKALDSSVHGFLNDLSSLGVYENSLVLILSDHGVRFGNIRETFVGYLEERMPFMFIWFPEWFRKKHPEKYGNLLVNRNRLTSPYDIHVTLKTLLQMNAEENDLRSAKTHQRPISRACPKCNGLFEVQPLERTCEDASIDVTWCLCSEFRDLAVEEKASSDVSNYIYQYIVNRTKELIKRERVKETLCSEWKFSRIYRCQEVVRVPKREKSGTIPSPNGKRMNGEVERIFVAIIELNPGPTKFEATVKMSKNAREENFNFQFLEYPKRLDGIYKTSKCVNVSSLKHYCYCTRQ